ncbi:MAG: cation:proton antiporter [Firmicutes bacterium]|jgi:Kef-type K+ transport system membrane component KefB|nr:cation:proton antiporter [Bacillota bacterium]
MSNLACQLSDTTTILLSMSIILFAGFLVTRATKLAKLPNVTGYIIAGVLIGPYVLNIIPHEMVESMGFINDIALAFIAFSVGRFFRKEVFKGTWSGVMAIVLFESLLAGVLITLSMHFIFHLDWDFCLLLGAIGTATAPASTMVTIRQYHARGEFVNTLLQVVAFDDAVCLIVFSIAIAIINTGAGSNIRTSDIALPLIYNIVALAIGFISGALLSKLMTPERSEDNRLILTISLLLGIAGLCAAVNVSPLLSCMLFGTTYINMTKDKDLYNQVEQFTPPILSLFFVVSGMSLDIRSFTTLGVIGATYFIIRIIGKYLGAYFGCMVAKTSKTIRNYLGLALVPQAGVAIGLAFLGERILPESTGKMLLTIILSSSVLYELIGPPSAKIALFYSGAIKRDKSIKS